MDEKIMRETPALSSLHMHRNPLCFVYRLPSETLEDVFIHYARDYHRTASVDPAPTVPTWVNVSYVSRRWRHVALNCATLWTYLFITSPRWTEVLLARSKQAPLKLHVDLDHDDEVIGWGLRSVKPVMNHVERIQDLRLRCTNRDVLSSITSRASCLQNLEIICSKDYPNWSWLPFGGDTPALRILKLTYCWVPWYSLKLSGLTALKLDNIPVQFQQHTEDFLATLGCMQDLTYLRLYKALASATRFLSSAAFHAFQKFDLPHLSRFEIMAQPSTVVALLSCINIPLKAELNLNSAVMDRLGSTPDHYALLCSLLAQRFTMSEDETQYGQTIRTLLVTFTQRRDAHIDFCTLEYNSKISFLPVWNRHFPLRIIHSKRHVTTNHNWERIICHTCCPIPLSNVRSLRVTQPLYSQTSWAHILGHLPSLRYLKLSHGAMPAIAPLLSLAPRDFTEIQGGRSDLGGNQVFAPDLEIRSKLPTDNLSMTRSLPAKILPFDLP
ncbi:hypothetical protein L210DRAFT_2361828 [Boletus edulis BED1]|uniref:F-box domain-containing protein n=1 Tax=Boletus edulis BED1 TaxID=1328754 RepID=A0AAD4BR70_BOLED|nr:hypothetical protein L210DRAFT_2361828 [Boletus edulis BED1]